MSDDAETPVEIPEEILARVKERQKQRFFPTLKFEMPGIKYGFPGVTLRIIECRGDYTVEIHGATRAEFGALRAVILKSRPDAHVLMRKRRQD
jgi:hypothetical protein